MLQSIQNVSTVKQLTLLPEANQKQEDNPKEKSWFARHPKTKAALKGAAFGLSTAACGALFLFTPVKYMPNSIHLTPVIGGGIGAAFGAMFAPKDSLGARNKWGMLATALLGGIAGIVISNTSMESIFIGGLDGKNWIPPILTLATGASAAGGVLVNTAINAFNKTKNKASSN